MVAAPVVGWRARKRARPVERQSTHHGAPGGSVGKYRFIAELGSGGMADVYLAVTQGLVGFTKLQVVKRLDASLQGDPDVVAMFLDEARLAARLNHPNVVQTNEVGEDEGQYFIAMEYIEGQSLLRLCQEHLKQRRERLPLKLHLRVVADVLSGLRYAHELTNFDGSPLGIVHRDVSPHNIMVTYEGVSKLVDFGIAKSVTNANETRAGMFKGKVGYSSPEQVRGGPADARADIFSVGVMLWEAGAGRRMWKGVPDVTVLHKVAFGEVPSLAEANPEAPADLARICHRALSPAPADRYPSVAALQADLEAFIEATWGRVGAGEIGALASEIFALERARLRSLVETKVAELAAHPERMPSLVNMRASEATSSTFARESMVAGPPSVVVEDRRFRRSFVGVAVACVLLGSSFTWLLVRRLPHLSGAVDKAAAVAPPAGAPAPPASAPAPPASAEAPASVEAPAPVLLSIKATPAEARLFLDDQPLPGNPYEAWLPPDGRAHPIRAEAEGFQASSEVVTLDRATAVQLALRPAVDSPPRWDGKVETPQKSGDDVPVLRPRPAKPKPVLDRIP
jgi:eukaryotic-like serine/threonine-protein kinase